MSVPLSVPAPVLTFDPVAGTFAPLEQPLAIAFASVRFPDGTPMTADDFVGANAQLSRIDTPGANPAFWDPETKRWVAAGLIDLTTVKGFPLQPPKTGAEPWQGLLVGAGQKDAAGAPLLAAASGHFPQYIVRGAFRAKRDAVEAFGFGPDSPPIEFASSVPPKRFAAELTPEPATATVVTLVLKNAAAQPAGTLVIDASGGAAQVTLTNCDGAGAPLAAVTLRPDGAVVLRPLPGRPVILDADVQAGRISYVSSADGQRYDLQ